MDDVRRDFSVPPHGTTPTAVITNQTKKFRSFKSKENIYKNEDEVIEYLIFKMKELAWRQHLLPYKPMRHF